MCTKWLEHKVASLGTASQCSMTVKSDNMLAYGRAPHAYYSVSSGKVRIPNRVGAIGSLSVLLGSGAGPFGCLVHDVQIGWRVAW